MKSALLFKDVNFSYSPSGKSRELAGVNGEIEAGKITVLTGVSGCGKSTLLYLAAGIYPQNAGTLISGHITMEGIDPASLPSHRRCRLVGMMFQNPELQFCMDTVENEIVFCLENVQTPSQKMAQIIDEALDSCSISHLRLRSLYSLSGGEKQKVMLACIVALRPKWLLVDEPFANIDDDSAAQIAKSLIRMNREHATGIVAVDHRLDHWIATADYLQIVGAKGSLLEKIDITKVQPAQIAALGISMPGQNYQLPQIPPAAAEELLVLNGITLDFGKHRILNDLKCGFQKGKIYAIVGSSGCGKSTLFSVLSGVRRANGKIIFGGKLFDAHKRRRMKGVAYVTQNPQDQFIAETVFDEITAGLKNKLNPNTLEKEAEKLLREINLWNYRKVSPYRLSQGQQRRLGVAALLAIPCGLLVCDEPTYAQDRKNTIAIMDTLQNAARKKGISVIFSTHDRQLAKDYADISLEMTEGKLNEIT